MTNDQWIGVIEGATYVAVAVVSCLIGLWFGWAWRRTEELKEKGKG